MSVSALLDTPSMDAMAAVRGGMRNRDTWQLHEHGDDTTVRAVYDRKASHIAERAGRGEPGYPDYTQLDAHIRSGSIDPVLLQRTSSGMTEISEGHHRIVRAHQLGVSHLPVSYDPGSQTHRYDWDDSG